MVEAISATFLTITKCIMYYRESSFNRCTESKMDSSCNQSTGRDKYDTMINLITFCPGQTPFDKPLLCFFTFAHTHTYMQRWCAKTAIMVLILCRAARSVLFICEMIAFAFWLTAQRVFFFLSTRRPFSHAFHSILLCCFSHFLFLLLLVCGRLVILVLHMHLLCEWWAPCNVWQYNNFLNGNEIGFCCKQNGK